MGLPAGLVSGISLEHIECVIGVLPVMQETNDALSLSVFWS